MEAAGIAAIVKAVAEYGVLGLGWVVALLMFYYIQVERKRYSELVIHIISHFTKVNLPEQKEALFGEGESKHKDTFTKLLGE